MVTTPSKKWTKWLQGAEKARMDTLLRQIAKGDAVSKPARDELDKMRARALKRAQRAERSADQ